MTIPTVVISCVNYPNTYSHMFITKAQNAKRYLASGHYKMEMHRIQGKEVGPLNGVWSARLTLEPAGFC